MANVGWSLAFFGAQSPLAGLVVIVPFWFLILATARAFAPLDRTAAWLLAPYLAWVAFATVLDASIVHLNLLSCEVWSSSLSLSLSLS